MKYGCSIKERQTKSGVVYDARWWYYDKDGIKRLGGAYGKATKRQANDAYLAFMKAYTPPKVKIKAEDKLLYDDVLERYFTQVSSENTEATIYDKKNVFKNFITPTFTGKDMRKITSEDLYAWQDELWAKELSYAYKMKIRTFFYNLLQWASLRCRVENPMKFVAKPRRVDSPAEMTIWEESEFIKFIKKVDDIMWKTFFIVLFYTGVRIGEANALTDAKIGAGRIVVNASVTRKTLDGTPWKVKGTKNRKNRTNAIVSIVGKQVTEYKKYKRKNGIEGDFFFLGNRPIPEQSYYRALTFYCEKAKVEKIRIHDFRHSYVSMLIYFGASPTLVANLIGDTLMQVLKTYGHLWKSEKDRVMQLMEQKLSYNSSYKVVR